MPESKDNPLPNLQDLVNGQDFQENYLALMEAFAEQDPDRRKKKIAAVLEKAQNQRNAAPTTNERRTIEESSTKPLLDSNPGVNSLLHELALTAGPMAPDEVEPAPPAPGSEE